MEMMTVKLFVIVVTYKGQQWYDRCFSSLRESTIPIQTIVVDNASNDGSIEFIQDNYPEILLIESRENLGFGRANNIGLKYALCNGADYVFLLNQDAWIEPSTLKDLVEIHSAHQDFGILSPMHLNAEKNHIEDGLLHYVSDYRITDFNLVNDMYFGSLSEIYETKYVNAAAWLLPRKILENVGGFDPIFLHYGEDDNYLQRAIYHQFKIGICPHVHVVHDTVRRLPKKANPLKTFNKDVLTLLTDITRPSSTRKMALFYLRKTIWKAVIGKLNEVKSYWNLLCFLIKNKKSIEKSRNQNKKEESSWL